MTIARPYGTPGAPDGCICLNPRQHPARQISPDFSELDRIVAQARLVLSLLVLLSLYVDPSTGGLFDVTKWQFITLVCHLFYSSSMYLVLRRGVHIDSVRKFSIALDLLFCYCTCLRHRGTHQPVICALCICNRGRRPWSQSTRHCTDGVVLRLALYSGHRFFEWADERLSDEGGLSGNGRICHRILWTTARQLRNPPSRARSGS